MTALTQTTRRKLSLLQHAEELGNVSKACRIMGYHRDTFYEVRRAFQVGGGCAGDSGGALVSHAQPCGFASLGVNRPVSQLRLPKAQALRRLFHTRELTRPCSRSSPVRTAPRFLSKTYCLSQALARSKTFVIPFMVLQKVQKGGRFPQSA
jgi:hypothetical protein